MVEYLYTLKLVTGLWFGLVAQASAISLIYAMMLGASRGIARS